MSSTMMYTSTGYLPTFSCRLPDFLPLGRISRLVGGTTSFTKSLKADRSLYQQSRDPLSDKGHWHKPIDMEVHHPVIFTFWYSLEEASISLNGWGWTLTSTLIIFSAMGTLKLSLPQDSILYTPHQRATPCGRRNNDKGAPKNDNDDDQQGEYSTVRALAIWIHPILFFFPPSFTSSGVDRMGRADTSHAFCQEVLFGCFPNFSFAFCSCLFIFCFRPCPYPSCLCLPLRASFFLFP